MTRSAKEYFKPQRRQKDGGPVAALTVGDIRRAIEGLPDDTPVVNDVVEGPDEWTAGIGSVEAKTPDSWKGVGGVPEKALWFHVHITPMDDQETVCRECGAVCVGPENIMVGLWHNDWCPKHPENTVE